MGVGGGAEPIPVVDFICFIQFSSVSFFMIPTFNVVMLLANAKKYM